MVEYSRVLFEFAKTLLGESVDVSLFTISKIRHMFLCVHYSRYTLVLVCSQLVTDMSLNFLRTFQALVHSTKPWADWCIEDKYDFFCSA